MLVWAGSQHLRILSWAALVGICVFCFVIVFLSVCPGASCDWWWWWYGVLKPVGRSAGLMLEASLHWLQTRLTRFAPACASIAWTA